MHSLTFLHKKFKEQLPNIHKIRLESFMTVGKSALMEKYRFILFYIKVFW